MFEKERTALLDFMETSQKTQKQLSAETGLSSSVISQFLKDGYPGDNEQVANTISKYLSIAIARLNAPRQNDFYKDLKNTQDVLFTCHYAHLDNDITLVAGDTGAGKTTALRFYEENNAGVIMVTANACTSSASAVLRLIAESVCRNVPAGREKLMKVVIDALAGTNKLLIIDEADHLSLKALQAIRNINDLAKVGVVLSGNRKLYNEILSSPKGYPLDQLKTRIIVRTLVINDYSVEEIKALFPLSDTACLAFLSKLSSDESLRTAKKIFAIASAAAKAKNQALSIALLKDTKKQFLGGFSI
ncbi:MAG: AAA family ATPase [Oscillospiraceae bacterium]|jgi:DNA transposition AAA+ family ATPase|nr:AAA family ATPase [Oscillospiraceae bacterium]